MRSLALSLLALPLLLTAACEEKEQPLSERSFFEGRPAAQQADPSNPPMTPPQARQIPTPPGAGAAALEWTVPEGWEARPPSNRMRRAEYGVPGEAGEAELVVFYFGPGQGGSPRDNAVRWARQFELPGGGDPVEAMETSARELNGREVMLVEVAGTYTGGGMPMGGGGGDPKPGYKLLGAVAEGPDAPWFFKLTGPEATVEAAREDFLALLGSLTAAGGDAG